MAEVVTLYGAPMSLFTGRVRSYFIKAGIPYREQFPTSTHFTEVVRPKAGNWYSMPTIEFANGDVIRDGVAIVDHFENQLNHPHRPQTPMQNLVSLLFDVIGAEGLLRPAMHYRWNFPEENLKFLQYHFRLIVPPGPDLERRSVVAADRMRTACAAFGAVPETFELIVELYGELLKKLEAHFCTHPYLLGNKPCIGDFGLIAPMFAHLGRDPKPLALMQTQAMSLYRWVERMNRTEADIGEFENQFAEYLPKDTIPQTLIDVLRHIAIDFIPETQAAADKINEWLNEQTDLKPGTYTLRGVGQGTFTVRGVEINALAQPFRFYLLQRIRVAFEALNEQDQNAARKLLQRCDMAPLLDIKLTRQIGRKNNREVWL